MKRDQFFSTSKYFRTPDIPSEGLALTIRNCTAEVLGRDPREVPVLAFDEDPRKFILNHTNWMVLANAFGSGSDDWIGRSIVLEAVDVAFKGSVVAGMRVQVPQITPPEDAGDAEHDGGGDDGIPF